MKKAGVGAEVLLDHRTVVFRAGSGGEAPVADVTRHRRVRLLTEAGRDTAAITVPYFRRFSRPVSFAARVVPPKGPPRELTAEDGIDVMAATGGILYTDNRALVLPAKDVPLGSVVEHRVTVRHEQPKLFAFIHIFGEAAPVHDTRLEVLVPTGWDVGWSARTMELEHPWDPEVQATPAGRTLSWSRADLAAITPEPRAPSPGQLAPRLQIQLTAWVEDGQPQRGFANPEELSVWMAQLTGDTLAMSPELERITAEVTRSHADPRARAEALYSWVQDNIRYCYLHVGYGAWRPNEPGRVLDLRYGDCKDKANLLRSLLSAASVPSRLVSTHAHSGFPHAFGRPTVTGNFNHMVLQVDLDDGPVLADPTTRAVPFGLLPAGLLGSAYLVIDPAGEGLSTAGFGSPEHHITRERYEVTVRPDGAAKGTFELTRTGRPAASLRARILAEGQHSEPIATALVARPLTTHGAASPSYGDAASRGQLDTSGGVTLHRVLTGKGATRLIRPSSFLERWLPELPATSARRAPVILGPPQRISQEVRITLPAGAGVGNLPKPVEAETAAGSWALSWALAAPQTLVVTRSAELRQPVVEAAAYEDVMTLVSAADRAMSRSLVVDCTGCTETSP